VGLDNSSYWQADAIIISYLKSVKISIRYLHYLAKWDSMQALQNRWPHSLVWTASFSGSVHIGQTQSSSISSTNSSLYPPSCERGWLIIDRAMVTFYSVERKGCWVTQELPKLLLEPGVYPGEVSKGFGTNPLKPNFLNICSQPVTTYNKDKAM